jgi:NADH:ubiquinone oxidoreductase subunit 6 (subunit J)
VDINWHTFFFLLFALITCAFAVAVVVTSNVVRMAFYLVVSLGASAGLFFLAGADFVGAMQLLIYVGGTLVLLIFGVMLTAQGPFVSMKTGGGDWILAAVVGGTLLAVLVGTALSVKEWRGKAPLAAESPPTSTAIGLALEGVSLDRLAEPNPDLRAGHNGYLLPFEIVSVHLLVVLIGAAYLARAKKRARPAT